MKTFFTLSLHLLITSFLFAQSPLGIPYQAVMRNLDGTVMASSAVDLTFMIHDGSATGTVVYQENHALTSSAQGLVSCVVGNGVVSQGNFTNINWGSGAKFLHVVMGTTDLGTQQMLSVPFALHANGVGVRVSATGDTLTIGGNSVIVPGISAANFPASVAGCTNAQACNYNASATEDDGSCLYQNATCDDGNANTMNDAIDGNCTCSGVLMVNGCTSAQACNFNPAANVDNGSCLYLNATCDDGNALTINDVVTADCVCAGTQPTFVQGNGVTDIDGNFYPSIIIGGQEWMQKNLAVTKYRNGNAITTGLSNTEWNNAQSGAYSSYPTSSTSNYSNYGKFYNWFAVNDVRGLCPTGWHAPSDAEWTMLETNLGGSNFAGGRMKTIEDWISPNVDATNESGFTGFPGGFYVNNNSQVNGLSGYWWSNTPNGSLNPNTGQFILTAWYRQLSNTSSGVNRNKTGRQNGYNVRCIRD
jgi:uncharacterized protein (TIGR02145 family)